MLEAYAEDHAEKNIYGLESETKNSTVKHIGEVSCCVAVGVFLSEKDPHLLSSKFRFPLVLVILDWGSLPFPSLFFNICAAVAGAQ
ncbi:hypothetical protein V6N12_031830 [Hibiscus sabdariffa]|uniref:Uncharacterized protein n=1 Tax=Hibiscus sabdariffa TaxID=183260 RepID=A0ABR2AKP0_9ROSI